MKKQLLLMLILVVLGLSPNLNAQNYYLSSSATTMGNGSEASPWNSFDPLNSLLSTASNVDTVFLKSGDVFREQLTISGTDNFVITSYGTGNRPVISGADSVTGWTSEGTYWKADFSGPVYNFFSEHQEQILARYPDASSAYLTVDAAASNSLTDAALLSISTGVLDESQVCVHTAQWSWEKSSIASSSGTTINYDTPTLRVPTANYGYFLYGHLSYLTTGREWFYDATAQKVYYQPEFGNPNSFLCEASVRPYGILFGAGISNVEIRNISFEKQSESGIAIQSVTNENIIIDNCSFLGQYKYGIDQQGRNVEISNSYFRAVDGLGVFLNGDCIKAEVHHNLFRDIGGFCNSGIGLEINLSAIKGAYVDSCHVHHNDIDSAGYCGISMDGRWNLVERNIVKNAMLLNNDGAALKCFGVASQYTVVRNNFVTSSDGNTEGTPNGSFITPAIYFDFSTNNCTIQENTVYGRTKKGIFLNSGTNNNTVIDNVIYGGSYLLDFNGSPIIPTPMTGMTVKGNVLFAKTPTDYVLRMVDNTGGYLQGEVDSNYYFQPYEPDNYAFIPPATTLDFDGWVSTTGHDLHSRSSFVSWNLPTSNDTLFMNQSDDVITISLGAEEYLDLDSNSVCGSITLQPYTSRILIRTLNNCVVGLNDEHPNGDWMIYPNPFFSTTTLSADRPLANATVLVQNSIGQLMNQKDHVSSQNVQLSRNGLSAGIYFVTVMEHDRLVYRTKILITDQ